MHKGDSPSALFIAPHNSQSGLLNNKPRCKEDYFDSKMTNY